MYAHAQITALALRELGFSDAPSKTVAGDPFAALGLRLSVRDAKIDCTPSRRDAMVADAKTQRELRIVPCAIPKRQS